MNGIVDFGRVRPGNYQLVVRTHWKSDTLPPKLLTDARERVKRHDARNQPPPDDGKNRPEAEPPVKNQVAVQAAD